MMGKVRIHNTELSMSGPIGNDGLPMDWSKLPASVQKNPTTVLVQLPQELTEKFWKCDDGHNDCGSMTTPLREFGKELS